MIERGGDRDRLVAACHCGQVRIRLPHLPQSVTHCNCSLCRKSGFWGVYFGGDEVIVEAASLGGYVRSDLAEPMLTTWHCPRCGVATHWTPLTPPPHQRIGINARLLDPALVEGLPVREVDGKSW